MWVFWREYFIFGGRSSSKTTGVWWSVWCYRPVWSGVGIPKAETEGRIHMCSYATPHEEITSYRLPDKGCFAFISHCFMSDCKISTFFHFVSVWDDPFPALPPGGGGGTPILGHGREVPRWWPHFWGFSIWLSPCFRTQHHPIDPFFLQKKTVCFYHLKFQG